MPVNGLIACPDCDLLQRAVPLQPRGTARCPRCGAELYRDHPDSLEHALAYTLGAIVLFVLANVFPILGLQVHGDVVQTTLLSGVRTLYQQDMGLVAALVLVTTIVMPLTELAGLVYLVLPLEFRRVPHWFAPVFRAMHMAREWSMVEVFLLGVLIALVKLSHIAGVVPGIALWSFGGLMLLLSAAASVFDPRALWARAGAAR